MLKRMAFLMVVLFSITGCSDQGKPAGSRTGGGGANAAPAPAVTPKSASPSP